MKGEAWEEVQGQEDGRELWDERDDLRITLAV